MAIAARLDEVAPGVLVQRGGVNCGVLTAGSDAVVINPGNSGLVDALRERGITRVVRVLFTHHRRELGDGLAELSAAFQPRIGVPAAEAQLFADPAAYWDNPNSRWLALCTRMPYHVTHTRPVRVDTALSDGDTIEFGDWRVSTLATPGYTDGAISCVCRRGDVCIAFTGDLIYRAGQVRDLYCLQRGEERNGHAVGDYHGFMGSARSLLASLDRVLGECPDTLVPAHGDVMDRPQHAVGLLRARMAAAYANYVSVSALRWYFPDYFAPFSTTPETLPLQQTVPPPPQFVRQVRGNLWLLLSDEDRAIVIDPFEAAAVDEVKGLIDRGEVAGVDGIWVTHYHCDHVQAIGYARELFHCPVVTDSHMSDILTYPERYFLTCLADASTTVDRPTRHGETWRWQNYTLTALHFPGQTYYHSGILAVPDDGPRLFFSGDSFTPTGVDDYCSWNRNFLGADTGFRRCVRLMREYAPDIIFNQHVEVGFHFSDDAWTRIDAALAARERLFADLLPWPHPDFGTDECWIRTCPYEQRVATGGVATVDVQITNHAAAPVAAHVAPVAPEGWTPMPAMLSAVCPSKEDSSLRLQLRVAADATPGRVIIPVHITFGEHDLGSFREAIAVVEQRTGDD